MSEPWEADGWDPWAAILRALTARSLGEPVDETEAQLAAEVVAGALFMSKGMSEAAVERLMARDHVIHLTYSVADDDIGIEIEWTDGEPGPQPGADAMTWSPGDTAA